jgi:hypothetical protein
MLSYSDGRENHPHRGFSTEATASYSHWRGLSELISIEQDNNHCQKQYVLCDDEIQSKAEVPVSSDRKIVLRGSLPPAQKNQRPPPGLELPTLVEV